MGQRLRQRRRELGLSAVQLAQHANITPRQVQVYEAGGAKNVSFGLVRLSQLLGFTTADDGWLLTGRGACPDISESPLAQIAAAAGSPGPNRGKLDDIGPTAADLLVEAARAVAREMGALRAENRQLVGALKTAEKALADAKKQAEAERKRADAEAKRANDNEAKMIRAFQTRDEPGMIKTRGGQTLAEIMRRMAEDAPRQMTDLVKAKPIAKPKRKKRKANGHPAKKKKAKGGKGNGYTGPERRGKVRR